MQALIIANRLPVVELIHPITVPPVTAPIWPTQLTMVTWDALKPSWSWWSQQSTHKLAQEEIAANIPSNKLEKGLAIRGKQS